MDEKSKYSFKEKAGPVLEEMKYIAKGRLKDFKEKPKVNWFIRLLLPLFIVFQAFFPGIIFGLGIVFVIVLIVVIIVIVILISYTSAGIIGGKLILDIITPIVIIVGIFFLTQLIGTPDYFSKAGKIPGGSLTVNVLFLASVGFCGLIFLFCKKIGSVVAGTVILWVALFIVIPFAFTYSKPYSLCMNLPYISQYCNPREVRVQGPEVVTIPVGGGVRLTYGAPEVGVPARTLYAGEPYEYTFTFTNYYSVPISFTLKPSIISRYASGIKFYFPFNQRIKELNAAQYYQDGVFIDPTQLTAKPVYGCPYYAWQISRTQNIPEEEVECARKKSCKNPEKACVKIDYMECKCADWIEATCSGAPLYLQTEVEHTGYFVGVAHLYYSSVNVPPKPAYKLAQGPLSVTVEFLPNPYIGPVHYYRDDISMYVIFKNLGGDITITSFHVEPLITNITTIDKEKKMMLEEIIGTEKKWCSDDVVGLNLPSGTEKSMFLCKFTPPYVKTSLINLTRNETVELNNVTFDRVRYYCEKIKTPTYYWNSVDWYKEGDVINVPGNFTIRIKNVSEEKANIIVERPFLFGPISIENNYSIRDGYGVEGFEFRVLNISDNSVQLNISSRYNESTEGFTFWSSYWEKIYQGIEESGLCEMLKKGNETEMKIVSSALKFTGVKINFTYTRNDIFASSSITPYTRTEACIKLLGSSKK